MIESKDIDSIHRSLSLTGTVIGQHTLKNINGLALRDAMALPKHHVPSSLDDLSDVMADYRSLSVEQLVAATQSSALLFKERYVAGQLLSVFGDPRIDTLNPEMIVVPGAKLTLGLAKEDVSKIVSEYAHYGVLTEWIEKETPTFTANIASFKLAKFCVTNQEYRDFMDDTGYEQFPTSWKFGIYEASSSNHPVHTISATDAEHYCQWLSKKTGRAFRLPTEPEWEYAAAGNTRQEFPWGDHFEADHANTVESGILRSTPVGIFPKGAGSFGHMDLSGNVEEYVANNYAAYPGAGLIVDDLLEKEGIYRVARGGSFTRFRDLARTRRRHGRYSSELYVMGFRLAESI